ncbi:MAG TPA: ArsR family transcriptional regulator [Chiayiivirga sp.]|nr:ArsR family transcriptional regulator [Chiayiivirga sp.]
MTKSFAERLTEDRRLVLLRILGDLPGYRSNSSVLRKLMDGFGHAVARDYIATQLQWLAEQALVALTDLDGVLVVELTPYGQDVASGLSHVPGVARPGA